MTAPGSVLVTGASSGLGRALALAYAEPGRRLILLGRDPARLAAVAGEAKAKGADVVSVLADVADRAGMEQALAGLPCLPDLVIANAGISGGTGGVEDPAEQTRRIFAVNVDGVLNSVLPLLEPMRRRRSGQVAIVSSLAGLRGLPGAPAYSASKAAVRAWGEGLRGWLARDGISVSVVCPGFVVTPMTAVNRFRMPFLMEADKAAVLIKAGLAAKRARIAFPWPMAVLMTILAALPPGWVDPLLARLPEKG